MKLLTKTTLAYIMVSAALLVPGGLIIRHLVETEFHIEVEEDLVRRRLSIQGQLASLAAIGNAGHQFEVAEVPIPWSRPPCFSDTMIHDPGEDERIPYRQYTYGADAEGRHYRIILRQSLLESDDLIDNISNGLGIILASVFAGIILANVAISRFLWGPFRKMLDAVDGFDWAKADRLALPTSSTREFDQLARVLERMGGKIQDHFDNLREFTANASHELQTPLAILLARLENLADSKDLTEAQAVEIQAMQDTAGRLSRMNRALLLLSRLEGRHYLEKVPVDLSAEARRTLREYAELAALKDITVDTRLDPPLHVGMNPDLAGILVSNLIRNAIQHNITGGRLSVSTADGTFTVRNSGPASEGDPEILFKRFRKANRNSESLGLGLAIAKKICDLSGLDLRYRYQDSHHILSVTL